MSASNTNSLGDVIREMLKTYKLETGIRNSRVISSWEKIVGPMIAKHTKHLAVRNHVLFARMDSPALIHELSFARTKIIKALNKEAGEEVIGDIRFY